MSRNADGADWNQTGRLASVSSFSVVPAMLRLDDVLAKKCVKQKFFSLLPPIINFIFYLCSHKLIRFLQ